MQRMLPQMMIVSVTRDPRDMMAIRESGVRATSAPTVSSGLEAALRPEIRLIVCDLGGDARYDLGTKLRGVSLPCPLLLRHDLSRQAIDSLYEVARIDADIRPSFREYDDLRRRLTDTARVDDTNATRAILSAFRLEPGRRRDFVAVMAVLGERPVMQTTVATAMGLSTSSFRAWLASVRGASVRLPSFPRLNAHFVALHLVWRRERLCWSGKRAAIAGGFADDKACANYLRHHFGCTSGQLLRVGGFDARVTALLQLFCNTTYAVDEARQRI